MDHMRISGNEPPSVILSQTKRFQKLKMIARKCQKQAEAKKDGVINLQHYNFNHFNAKHFYAPKTLRINRSRP